ncbi:GNAT family N-acetyltransferase [Chitinimonas viridis]|uniref:GNAT family N-acetyltransferase n=1 Tax=Chitinimonas viridis TaxID=664880 RepID=A0ABT8B618_9NEIS|nr:GNAT family N-acetyltransferase [Chitinimonas viridis]MDN3577672.1 GNAT family N-acetyltransferase [Chitinimonas viridis]
MIPVIAYQADLHDAGIVALFAACAAVDADVNVLSMARWQHFARDPGRLAGRDFLVVELDGQLAGMAYSGLEEGAQGMLRYGRIMVHPAFRRRGVARAIMAGLLAMDGGRLPLECALPARWLAGLAFAQQQGFAVLAEEAELRRALPVEYPPAPGVAIRPLRQGDADDMAAWCALSNAAYASHVPPVTPATVAELAHRASLPGCSLGFVEIDGRPQGLVQWEADSDSQVYLNSLLVHPARQGQGLGRSLLRWALQRMAEQGAQTVELTVSTANTAALRLYLAHGFEQYGTTCYLRRPVAI